MQARRGVAVAALVVLLILVVFGVKSCRDSAHTSALRSYDEHVANLVGRSQDTSRRLFASLSAGGGSGAASTLQTQIDQERADAAGELNAARSLSAPGEMDPAQRDLVLAMRMRSDAVAGVAANIQPALGNVTNRDALAAIAGDMARFYASDVLYKVYAVPVIVAALHGAGIAVGGQSGEPVASGQFLPGLGWLTSSYIAGRLGAAAPASANGNAKPTPGTHGHSLDSVSVNGTTLQTGSTNPVARTPPPAFTLTFTNGGTNTESNVVVKVTVSGTSLQAQAVVPQTLPGQPATAKVTLPSAPSAGTYTVTATVEAVPGEGNKANNTLAFPVTFG